MAKRPKEKLENIETEPGAWDRFEKAVDAAVKSGPMHRTKTRKTQGDDRRQPKKTSS